ncbi:MAG: outer membrane lipoprotein-sorting protein [Acidobacteria bacterium]|nr:outer membrane lipoprotein-sorting protein [Acidobacteriota bacterium]MBI3664531.1 outer membrane lipoprotein-sorting protein [Acidobacteriota bacterium]
MRRTMLTFLVGVLLLCMPAAAQTVDEVISKNIQAHGGPDKLKAVRSMRLSGRMTLGQGLEAPITIEVKRPMQLRMEFTFQGMTAVQAYDGAMGWQIMPFMGKEDPEPLSADDLKEVREQADLEGPLMEYKAKGHQVELMGKETVEGTECYKLKLTRKEGDVSFIFLEADSWLEIRMTARRMVRGNELEIETSLGDYKEVQGLILPHVTEFGRKGSPQKQKISIDKIELNVALDDARFKMPEVKPAGPKPAGTSPPAVF